LKPQLQAKTPAWERAVTIGLYLALVVLIFGLGYLSYLILVGKLVAAEAVALPSVEQSLSNGLLIFGLGLWLFVALGLIQWRNAGLFGWLLLVFGFVFYFGFPALLSLMPTLDFIEITSPARRLVTALQQHGAGIICLGALRIVFGMVLRHFTPAETTAVTRTAAAAKGKATSIMRNCWELGFCKSVLKQHCPRFLKRITCWKAKSGCYCDDSLSRSLMVSARALVEGEAPMEAQRSVQRARQSASFLASGRPGSGNRPVCVSCPIYQDHQRYKYRFVAFLMYPATAAIMWFITPFIRTAWWAMDAWMSTIMGYARILPTESDKIFNTPSLDMDFSWVAVVFVAVTLLSLLMRFVEWLIMDRGL